MTDITRLKEVEDALRESESLYRGVVESPLAGIAILDSDYNMIYINEYFSEMTGYSVEEIKIEI
ncbi:MAG: PAS domain S-box protein [Candidatus Marinimicrobia bacterium]|nr:PAS domain S-box protein [Candidatus Neomarinimicrobiota bacterium]